MFLRSLSNGGGFGGTKGSFTDMLLLLLHFDKSFGFGPLAFFSKEAYALINDEFSALADDDLTTFERTRCRTFEVHSVHVEARTVTRTFELCLGSKPTWRAAKMRADSDKR